MIKINFNKIYMSCANVQKTVLIEMRLSSVHEDLICVAYCALSIASFPVTPLSLSLSRSPLHVTLVTSLSCTRCPR